MGTNIQHNNSAALIFRFTYSKTKRKKCNRHNMYIFLQNVRTKYFATLLNIYQGYTLDAYRNAWGFYVSVCYFCSILNWKVSSNFSENSNIKFHENVFNGSCIFRTEGQTGTAMLTDAFLQLPIANELKSQKHRREPEHSDSKP